MSASDLPYRPCAGVVLVNADGHVFAGQRIDHAGGAWQMPQGGIDAGEDPRAAALRELEEETGVPAELVTVEAVTDDWIRYDLPDELLGKVWGGKYRGQEQKWFLFRFKGRDDDIDIATDHPEFSAWSWVQPDELLEQIVPFKRDVYEAVFAAFRDNI
ncbi:RNA pyrophosphohydrolase [Palleronia sp. LCG004]|uniref:RNA pyrophosphohydrolase n=1 Tax=Palleronia sp. LCG004 TaxID=3079304 RepID=UPI002941EB0C|nr:RNA pyrophosphohydrolase [Palleronia sp. LCG004]WOI56023.1 RNA pyrophosphohydrolase [Palleronia sp. LCG004]